MSILIIGVSETATRVVRCLEAWGQPVQRCRSVGTAVENLDLEAPIYSLIMIDEDGSALNQLLNHLHAIDSDTPVATVGSPSRQAGTHPWCRIERRADGTQWIRQGTQAASVQPATATSGPTLADQPVAFAYNAPCSRVG